MYTRGLVWHQKVTFLNSDVIFKWTGFARLDVPSLKVDKNDDVIGGYGAVDSSAILFLSGNGMDTNPVEI